MREARAFTEQKSMLGFRNGCTEQILFDDVLFLFGKEKGHLQTRNYRFESKAVWI